MSRRILFLLAFALAASTRVLGAIVPDLTSQRVDTDTVSGDLVFSGNARLQYQATLLLADEIRYNPRSHVASARGHVSLTRGPRRLLADQITYQLENHTFSVTNLRVGEFPIYVTAPSATGARDRILARDAILTYSEPTSITPSVHASTVTYVENESVTAESARLGLGMIVPVTVPKFQHSLREPLLTNTQIHFGYRGSLGAHLGAGGEFPVLPWLEAGGDVSFYSARGVLVGPSATYALQNPDQDVSGTFNSGFIHDYGNRLNDVLDRPISANRGFIDWTHHQEIGEHLMLIGQLHYWSDSDVVRDFIPEEYFPLQTPDNFFEGVYSGNNYTVSLFTRFQPTNYILTQQRLPEVHFTLAPTPIGLGVYERFEASAAVLRQNQVENDPALNTSRFDTFYELTRPWSPRPWFTFTPVAGGRLTYYSHTLNDQGTYTRGLGEVGFDANLTTSAIFPFQNERWNIDGIRHLLVPRISYRYVPGAEKGQAYIPPIDDTVFTTYLQPLDIFDQRNIDQLHRTNTLRLELDNTFQTRDKQYGSRDLLSVNFAADLEFDRKMNQNKVSDLETQLSFTPVPWLRFDLYNSMDPKNFAVQELNMGVRLIDADRWSVLFANRYLAGQIQEYVIDGRYRLNEVYETFANIHYDERANRFIERTVGVRQNLRNLWSIEYAVSFYSGRRRESDFGFTLRVNLIGL